MKLSGTSDLCSHSSVRSMLFLKLPLLYFFLSGFYEGGMYECSSKHQVDFQVTK